MVSALRTNWLCNKLLYDLGSSHGNATEGYMLTFVEGGGGGSSYIVLKLYYNRFYISTLKDCHVFRNFDIAFVSSIYSTVWS